MQDLNIPKNLSMFHMRITKEDYLDGYPQGPRLNYNFILWPQDGGNYVCLN